MWIAVLDLLLWYYQLLSVCFGRSLVDGCFACVRAGYLAWLPLTMSNALSIITITCHHVCGEVTMAMYCHIYITCSVRCLYCPGSHTNGTVHAECINVRSLCDDDVSVCDVSVCGMMTMCVLQAVTHTIVAKS